jgi:hypothetical protein
VRDVTRRTGIVRRGERRNNSRSHERTRDGQHRDPPPHEDLLSHLHIGARTHAEARAYEPAVNCTTKTAFIP